jgi:hypothetical protein
MGVIWAGEMVNWENFTKQTFQAYPTNGRLESLLAHHFSRKVERATLRREHATKQGAIGAIGAIIRQTGAGRIPPLVHRHVHRDARFGAPPFQTLPRLWRRRNNKRKIAGFSLKGFGV